MYNTILYKEMEFDNADHKYLICNTAISYLNDPKERFRIYSSYCNGDLSHNDTFLIIEYMHEMRRCTVAKSLKARYLRRIRALVTMIDRNVLERYTAMLDEI